MTVCWTRTRSSASPPSWPHRGARRPSKPCRRRFFQVFRVLMAGPAGGQPMQGRAGPRPPGGMSGQLPPASASKDLSDHDEVGRCDDDRLGRQRPSIAGHCPAASAAARRARLSDSAAPRAGSAPPSVLSGNGIRGEATNLRVRLVRCQSSHSLETANRLPIQLHPVVPTIARGG